MKLSVAADSVYSKSKKPDYRQKKWFKKCRLDDSFSTSESRRYRNRRARAGVVNGTSKYYLPSTKHF